MNKLQHTGLYTVVAFSLSLTAACAPAEEETLEDSAEFAPAALCAVNPACVTAVTTAISGLINTVGGLVITAAAWNVMSEQAQESRIETALRTKKDKLHSTAVNNIPEEWKKKAANDDDAKPAKPAVPPPPKPKSKCDGYKEAMGATCDSLTWTCGELTINQWDKFETCLSFSRLASRENCSWISKATCTTRFEAAVAKVKACIDDVPRHILAQALAGC